MIGIVMNMCVCQQPSPGILSIGQCNGGIMCRVSSIILLSGLLGEEWMADHDQIPLCSPGGFALCNDAEHFPADLYPLTAVALSYLLTLDHFIRHFDDKSPPTYSMSKDWPYRTYPEWRETPGPPGYVHVSNVTSVSNKHSQYDIKRHCDDRCVTISVAKYHPLRTSQGERRINGHHFIFHFAKLEFLFTEMKLMRAQRF